MLPYVNAIPSQVRSKEVDQPPSELQRHSRIALDDLTDELDDRADLGDGSNERENEAEPAPETVVLATPAYVIDVCDEVANIHRLIDVGNQAGQRLDDDLTDARILDELAGEDSPETFQEPTVATILSVVFVVFCDRVERKRGA